MSFGGKTQGVGDGTAGDVGLGSGGMVAVNVGATNVAVAGGDGASVAWLVGVGTIEATGVGVGSGSSDELRNGIDPADTTFIITRIGTMTTASNTTMAAIVRTA